MAYIKSDIPTRFLERPCRYFEPVYQQKKNLPRSKYKVLVGSICLHSDKFLDSSQSSLPCSVDCPNYEWENREVECLICGTMITDPPILQLWSLTADNVTFPACSPNCLKLGENLFVLECLSEEEKAPSKGCCSVCGKIFETPINQKIQIMSRQRGVYEFCSHKCLNSLDLLVDGKPESRRMEYCRYFNQEHLYNNIVNLPRNIKENVTCRHPLHREDLPVNVKPADCSQNCPDYLPITFDTECPYCRESLSIGIDEIYNICSSPHSYAEPFEFGSTHMVENYFLNCDHCCQQFALVLDAYPPFNYVLSK